MKRFLIAIALTALCCLVLAAAPAEDGPASFGSAQVVTPYYTVLQNGSDPTCLLDGSSATDWAVYVSQGIYKDGNADAVFYFDGVSLDGLWIRGGNYTNETAYYNGGFPTQIILNVVTSGYRVQIGLNPADLYNPYASSGSWSSGYQYLAFPQRYTAVSIVEMTVQGCRTGNGGEQFRISDIAFVGSSGPQAPSAGSSWSAGTPRASLDTTLSMRMATRSGPSTNYTGLGSYFSPGDSVRIITAAWDRRNNIWWVQVEFTYRRQLRRAYTGLKRVNASIVNVPEESVYCSAHTTQSAQAWYGPGTNYTGYDDPVPAGTYGTVYNVENGFVQLEYTPVGGTMRRVWIDGQYVQRD